MLTEPSFTIGMEEEYLLVDKDSRALLTEPTKELLADLNEHVPGGIMPEFLKSQVEIGTSKCSSLKEAALEIKQARRKVAEVSAQHSAAPIAASTHPFAIWEDLRHSEQERYVTLARDLEGVGRRMVICGMHVHVGLDDDDLRMDLMGQVTYFLPHLLALSTSSPFWRGKLSGLKSYRLAVFDELPRTGLPEDFESWGEYQRHLNSLIDAGVIQDATKLWWDLRPSTRFPTLELRISDICTRAEDGVAVAAIYICLLRMLYRLKRSNQRWRRYANMLVQENRWRAQRYGIDEGLIDFGKSQVVPYGELLEEIFELVAEDADALDCRDELLHARTILKRGTSAHRQEAVYHAALKEGASSREALEKVVDFLISETVAGV
ncbi:carboxylate-amine ligase [Rhodovibrionaceae bacterium A322]